MPTQSAYAEAIRAADVSEAGAGLAVRYYFKENKVPIPAGADLRDGLLVAELLSRLPEPPSPAMFISAALDFSFLQLVELYGRSAAVRRFPGMARAHPGVTKARATALLAAAR